MARKKQTFDMKKEVRKLARERVGTVPSSGRSCPSRERNKPKHKKPLTARGRRGRIEPTLQFGRRLIRLHSSHMK
jgi:hypothetical protein